MLLLFNYSTAEWCQTKIQRIVTGSHIAIETVCTCIYVFIGIEYLGIVAILLNSQDVILLQSRKIEHEVYTLSVIIAPDKSVDGLIAVIGIAPAEMTRIVVILIECRFV